MTEERLKSVETRCGKRKRGPCLEELEVSTVEQRIAKVEQLNSEMKRLFEYYSLHQRSSAVLFEELERVEENGDQGLAPELQGRGRKLKSPKMEGLVAQLTDGSHLTLTELVSLISLKLAASPPLQQTSPALVRTAVLSIGHRVPYGISDSDADSLEDNSPSALWCWEIRDLKLLPKLLRPVSKARRAFRRSVYDRITAIFELIQALKRSEHDPGFDNDIIRAFDRLGKVLPVSKLPPAPDAIDPEAVASRSNGELDQKQKLADNIKEAETQHKLRLELHKEAQKQEREQKRLLREAEKNEKLKKKEELERQKMLRKQQEEADKEQKQREKEEAELKSSIARKKQASIMEKFVKRIKPVSVAADEDALNKATQPDLEVKQIDLNSVVATQLMDKVFSSQHEMTNDEMRMAHLSSWKQLGHLIRLNKKQHWSIRRKPKVDLYKEPRLTAAKYLAEHESVLENLTCAWEDKGSSEKMCVTNGETSNSGIKLNNRKPQLLQFDKSCRPAFYGIWPKQSSCVGPRHPFRKDSELDYDVDSDEEWEEEEPGESLSDLDKDDEEGTDQGCCRADDDESEDGFFVPDGYLSENEGVQVDRMEMDATSEVRTSSSNDTESEYFWTLLKQQKYLNNLTEGALRKNQPFIVNNTMHNKLTMICSDGSQNLEKTCLQTLCMRPFPGLPLILIESEDLCSSNGTPGHPSESASLPPKPSDMPNSVSLTPTCSHNRFMKAEISQPKSPVTPVSQLTKIRKITDFMDASLQTKRVDMENSLPVLTDDVGKQHVSTFFLKRCLPPTEEIGE